MRLSLMLPLLPLQFLLSMERHTIRVRVKTDAWLMSQRTLLVLIESISGVDVFRPIEALSTPETTSRTITIPYWYKASGLVLRPVGFTDCTMTRQLKVGRMCRFVGVHFLVIWHALFLFTFLAYTTHLKFATLGAMSV